MKLAGGKRDAFVMATVPACRRHGAIDGVRFVRTHTHICKMAAKHAMIKREKTQKNREPSDCNAIGKRHRPSI